MFMRIKRREGGSFVLFSARFSWFLIISRFCALVYLAVCAYVVKDFP